MRNRSKSLDSENYLLNDYNLLGPWQPKIAVGIATEDPTASQPFVALNCDIVPVDMILRLAREMGIPILRDESLARQLATLEVDEEIPPEFLEAVERSIRFLQNNTDDG